MKRRIVFIPAFDRTDPDPKKNYGVGCLDLRFLVEGDKGVVEFHLLTQWYLKHVMKRRFKSLKEDVLARKEDFLIENFLDPYPADLCYYSPVRLSEDDSDWKNGVSYLGDKPCFYGYKYTDDNGFVAKEVAYWILVEHGDEALWKYLEEYHKEVFGEDNA